MRSTKLPLWIERLTGLEPVPVPPHVFALDALPYRLRYGSFHRGPQGFVFDDSLERELSPELFGDGPLGAPLSDPKNFQEEVLRMSNSIEAAVTQASLVLPDSWLRMTFVETGELPRRRRDRQEVLHWKLKRLVPFRVEELRITAQRVTPFPQQEEPLRLLVAFGLERLLAQIEDAFLACGIEIGSITNTTLSLVASLQHCLDDGELGGLVSAFPDHYTLTFFTHDELVLYRYKPVGVAGRPDRQGVHRDLRLTDNFLQQHFSDRPVSRLFLACDEEDQPEWLDWLGGELGAEPEVLSFEHFRITRTQVGPSWLQTAPLLGAASLEV